MYSINLKKLTNYLFVFLFLIMQSACFAQKKDLIKGLNNENQSKKMEPVTLLSFRTDYTVQKGQRLEYSYESNPSVGNTADYVISDDKTVAYIDKEVDSNHTGGEGGNDDVITFVFEAVKAGKCEIIIKDYFRDELKDEHIFVITVE